MASAGDLKKIVKPLRHTIILSIARVYAGSSGVTLRNFTMVSQRAVRDFEADPFRLGLSTSQLEHWVQWGEWMVRQFHRSSSAVEGRNGRLYASLSNVTH